MGLECRIVALLPCIAESAGRTPSWLGLRIADELAYSAGIWLGCLQHRVLRPLLPQFTGTGSGS